VHLLLAVALGLLPILILGALWRRRRVSHDVPVLRALGVALGAALLSVGCVFAELGLLHWTGLSVRALPGKETEALLAVLAFVAPLEEGAKVLSVWPLYASRRIFEVRHGVWLAAVAGVAFAAAKTTLGVAMGGSDALWLLRLCLAMPAQVASAVLWGAVLGARARTSWFALAWSTATLLSGAHQHLVLGRGPGLLVLAVPLLAALCALAYAVVRRTSAREAAIRASFGRRSSERPSEMRRSDPPSLGQIWRAVEPGHAPLMIHWIGLGTLVTAGVSLMALLLALYAGHALGLDFSSANEGDVRSNGPLVFLAAAVALAFPIAGYLVARASGTRSVLEPALGASLAVLGAVLFLSVTTPIAAIFALALTPIAFLLASAGAWFGIAR
jgi:hypothetical protein